MIRALLPIAMVAVVAIALLATFVPASLWTGGAIVLLVAAILAIRAARRHANRQVGG
ncbi:hypothetical protein MWU52_07820 [Jannaschia sp. S6380]|uniref:hypothetical protein n=1 Tax=Jannaschia sp. S6380 TaxID=2926408 RepID=UPI001FF5E34F|nr:hypothetical protein [Jannaschia sp. S6380]MCK0167450.1 hypothetical protein [Jannaschia sp. S6380]